MKKKIILIFIIIFIFVIFVIFNYKGFMISRIITSANNNYNEHNFTGSLTLYNISNIISSGSELTYNLGNTYYKIGENEKNIDRKIENYKLSLANYSKILENTLIKNEEIINDTNYNYEFVNKKLEELENTEEEEEEEKEEKENGEDQENEDKNGEKKNEGSDDEKNNEGEGNIVEDEKNNEGEGKIVEDEKITPTEVIQIGAYVDKLKNEQKNNRKFYNNTQNMQRDPFFDNIINRDSEKDW